MAKITVSIDSQWLDSMQACHRQMKFKFVDNLRPVKKSEYLEKGDLLHQTLDTFYTAYELPYNERIKAAVEHGKNHAIKLSLPMEDCNEVLYQFQEYAEHYRMDGWLPAVANGIPLVEHTFSIVFHEDDDIKIIYCGKIDLIAQTPVGLIIVDHKSESRRSDPSTLTNQFIGYANALQIYNVWINKIGFQKTLKREERFRRILKSYNKEWVAEWKVGVIADIKRAAEALQTGKIHPNFTACDKFTWGCDFKILCETTADNREFKARTFFTVGEPWDPYHTKKDE